MLAGVITVRMNAKLGTSLSAVHLFENPTVEALAASLDPTLVASAGAAAPQKLIISPAPFKPEERSKGVICSVNQQQMLAVSMGSAGLAYNQLSAYRLQVSVSNSCRPVEGPRYVADLVQL